MENRKPYYDLLRIQSGATREEIERAYLEAEQEFHQERFADDPVARHKAQARLRAINEAYLALTEKSETARQPFRGGRGEAVPNKVIPTEEIYRETSATGGEPGGAAAVNPSGPMTGRGADRVAGPAEQPEAGRPVSFQDNADAADSAALLKKETALLFFVAGTLLLLIAISLIRTSGNKPAPTSPAGSAPATPSPTASAPPETPAASPERTGNALRKSRHPEGDGSVDAILVRRDAEQGIAEAQAFLGYLLLVGEGMKKDTAQAVRWFRLAAAQGNAEAQNWLGYLNETGKVVKKDYPEAVRWYRLAAEQGDSDAQKNLGLMYIKGRGVGKDGREGVKWLRKAAAQGNGEAQRALDIWQEE